MISIALIVCLLLMSTVPVTTPELAQFALMNPAAREESLDSDLLGPKARLFDRFGAVSSNDEKARLDNYALELNSDPSAQGFIIVYGRRSRPGEAKKRADRQKQYLMYYRSIATERLVSLDHCFKTRLEVELWIVPRGAKAPVPCPTRVTKR